MSKHLDHVMDIQTLQPHAHLSGDIIAPYGWDLVGKVGVCLEPTQPAVMIGAYWYVPARPKPRVWEGTVKLLADEVTSEPWNWGDDVAIRIEELTP